MIDYNWDSLTSEEFEELSMELMRKKSFNNVYRLSGIGPGDEGRDIHAEEFIVSATGGEIHTKLLVQCKNYFGSQRAITPTDVEEWSLRAQTLGYNRLLIITSYDLSSNAKTKAKEISDGRSLNVHVQWWNKYELSRILIVNPAIKRRYQLEVTTSPTLKIGILNGYLDDPATQTICHKAFSEIEPEDWLTFFDESDLSVNLINFVDISDEFDAIMNPFGEIYPESDADNRTSYSKILDYIQNGGVFVGSGGFPFFYYYDYEQNNHFTATEPTLPLFDTRSGSWVNFFSFNDVKFSRDFNVSIFGGDIEDLDIYQEDDDIRCVGDLLDLGHTQITQFRSINNPDGSHIIPLLRVKDHPILPLAAVKKGYGYYIHSGFHTHVREAKIISVALKNWLRSAGGQLPIN